MKKFFVSTICVFLSIISFGQKNVGINTATPDPSAALDVVATDKGILIPRMDSVQREAIEGPALGLMVFDSSMNSFWFYGSEGWREIVDRTPDQFENQLRVNGDTLFLGSDNFLVLKGLSKLSSLMTIQDWLDDGKTPCALFEEGVPLDSLYGKMYQGGVIFHLDTINCRGLVVTASDVRIHIEWKRGGYFVTNASETGLFTGQANTDTIVSQQGTDDYAAYVCDTLTLHGYTDWFLPSKDELHLVHRHIQEKGLGGFLSSPNAFYWSSTEYNEDTAWIEVMDLGQQTNWHKGASMRLRAVRSFDQ